MIMTTYVHAISVFPAWIAEYIAVGIVVVRPGIFPANMRVAPNSPSARANAKIDPVISACFASGIVMCVNILNLDTPSTSATVSMFLSTDKNPVFADWYIKGIATTVLAITAAYHVKSSDWSKSISINCPTKPCLPKIIIKINPTTVGGNTSGSMMSVSTITFPGKFFRAKK